MSVLTSQPRTDALTRTPTIIPGHSAHASDLQEYGIVLLQFFPSGTCLPLLLETPTILGRMDAPVVDLTSLGGVQHGVSRQHCLLRRDGARLIISDLGSTNGTILNDQPLIPYQEYAVGDGAHLILGTLHLTLFLTTH